MVDKVEETVDYLEVDNPITGQNYVCISFVSPEKTLVKKEQFEFFEKCFSLGLARFSLNLYF